MAITYAQLTQLVQDTLENTEASFVSNIPVFVRGAEQRIMHSVQLPAMRKTTTATALVSGNSSYAAPSDFLAPFEFSITIAATGAQAFLLNKDVNFIREAFPISTATGQPTHYAITSVAATTPFATSFLLGPTPDANYATTLDYYAYPASITAGTTSWLGDNFESVLIYGTLREAYVYLKGEQDLIDRYEKLYLEALALLKGLADGKDRKDTYRGGQFRLPVG